MSGKHLAIQASAQHIRFVTLLNEQVLRSDELSIRSDERLAREDLDTFFREHTYLAEHDNEVSLSWSSQRSTLIPNAIFSDTTHEDIFRLCYGNNFASDDVDYNRISEHGIIHVYEIPVWVKRYFVVKFPRIVHQHEGTHLLRKIMQSAFKLKATLVLHSDYFLLSLVRHNELEFYGSFRALSHEDILYHLMFTLQQKERMHETGSIELVEGHDADKTLLPALENALLRVGNLKAMGILKAPNFVAQSQLLCV
ncbi:MAG: hypothetical protein A3D92_01480 [Bacteroidetes bacterium RIFCSPHIGHO2_02_FULL_44_7]|nr:MAG: hypothetical protein A3D92_01480 [Bacteroidetes bacterium RIFCSPHIGHO2_02_FULL_44_7]